MAGFNTERPACFVLEGFLYYFDEATVRRTLAALSEIAVEGSRIGASAVSCAISDNSSRFVWGTDEPEVSRSTAHTLGDKKRIRLPLAAPSGSRKFRSFLQFGNGLAARLCTFPLS